MKFAFLPNYFKKIGITCFIASMAGFIFIVTFITIKLYGEYASLHPGISSCELSQSAVELYKL